MAAIYAYQIYYNGYSFAAVPARYKDQTLQILRTKYGYTDEMIAGLTA
jgi:hypothetical protein